MDDVDITAVRIPTGEGTTTLAGVLFRSAGADPAPAIVCLFPYRSDALGGAGLWGTMRAFAAAGYASLLVDLRGHGSSDGSARPPFDPDEGDDGVAAVTWAAGQPWCDATVGLWGFSYGALLALRTAIHRPAPLRAVVSVMGMLDPERDFVHPGGAAGCLTALGLWGSSTLVNLLLPPLGADRHHPEERRRWLERAQRAEPYLLDLYRHGPGDPIWAERRVDPAAITVPVFSIGGWRDMFADAAVRLYERVAGPRQLLVGPWSHLVPRDDRDEPVDVHVLAVRWFDRWLRPDRDVPTEAPVTVFVQGDDPRWQEYEQWPPESRAFVLSAGPDRDLGPGRLSPVVARTPSDPTVGAGSGLWGIPTGRFGRPLDQHDDDALGLAFTTGPMATTVLLAGRPTVRLATPNERLVVRLTDVDPHGRSMLITGGIHAGPAGVVELALDPTCYQLPAGHRLRLVVSDSATPRLWPAPAGEILVTAATLSLPLAAGGKPASLPEPAAEPATVWLRYDPLWMVSRDITEGRVSIAVGDVVAARLPGRDVGVDTESRITVTAGRPPFAGADPVAELCGRVSVSVRDPLGEDILTRVELRLSPDSMRLHGQVTVGGDLVVDRNWQL